MIQAIHNAGGPHRLRSGFSLIELMIVVAILSILSMIAYPMYTQHVRKARRVEAKSLLLKAANREEQLYTANQNAYLGSMEKLGLPNLTENGAYRVTVNAAASDSQWYTITAVAQNDQAKDTCRTILVDSKGLKTAWSGEAATKGSDVSTTCW